MRVGHQITHWQKLKPVYIFGSIILYLLCMDTAIKSCEYFFCEQNPANVSSCNKFPLYGIQTSLEIVIW